MTRRRRLVGAILLSAAAVGAVMIAAVIALSGGDIAYALRVVSHGESGTDDVEWKRSVPIPAESPLAWTRRDRCDDVRDVAGGRLDAALLTGGATQLVIIRHGELICQWAAPGHRIDEPRPVFSISKTVTALLVSRAVDAGKLSWEDPITRWVPELGRRDHRFARITLADLVDMRSGIGFRVSAGFPWLNQDAPRVYYASDLEAATLDGPAIESAPGPFTYNDWAPNLLGIAYRRATGHLMVGPDAARLWSRLGAEHAAQWLVDDHGFPWQESGFVASAPDLARIGQQLLTDRTSDFGRRSASASSTPIVSHGHGVPPSYGGVPMGYGNGMWILHDTDRPTYAALGRHGQVMIVDPATDTVIVRLGNSGYEKAGSEPQIAVQLERWARRL